MNASNSLIDAVNSEPGSTLNSVSGWILVITD